MSTKLEGLLAKVDERYLRRLIPGDLRRTLTDLLDIDPGENGNWLPRCVLAVHGTSLFRRPEARSALFSLLPDEELVAAAKALCRRSYDQPDNNATALSGLKWSPGAPVVDFVAGRFPIPYAYLPRTEVGSQTIDTLEVFSPLPPLHDYQQGVKAEIQKVLSTPGERALVQMPTGSGKTRTVVDAIVEMYGHDLHPGAVVWLAHAEELCDQAVDAIGKAWAYGAKDEGKLIRYYGAHEPPAYAIPGSVIVASLQKVFARLRSDSPFIQSLRSATKLVVVDEAHRALAPSFHAVVEALTEGGGSLIGLSATPGRGIGRDQENRKLSEMFGGHLITPTGEDQIIGRLEREGVLAHVTRRVIDTGVSVTPSDREAAVVRDGFDYGGRLLGTLASKRGRNELLLDMIVEQVRLERPTLVFACTVKHAQLLSAALSFRGVMAAHIDGNMARVDRRHAVQQFREGQLDVLVNFGILTTGFDAPRTRTVVVARPTMSAVLYGQMIGRALRGPKMGGGAQAWVIDVRDNIERFGTVDDIYQAFERFWDTPD